MNFYIENEDLIENVFEIVQEVNDTQSNKPAGAGERREVKCKKLKEPKILEKVSNEKINEILKDLEKYKTEGKTMCPICKDSNNTLFFYGTLRRHINTLHGNRNKAILHQCYRCRQGFPSTTKLRKHINNLCRNITINESDPRLRNIPKIFEIISQENMNEILENFKENTACNIICPICKHSEKRFSIGSLRRHLLIRHRNGNKADLHPCPNCNECFSSYAFLENHNRKHHKSGTMKQKRKKFVSCRKKIKPISGPKKISKKQINEILKDLENYKTLDGKILCPICKENMNKFCSLRRHILLQHGNVDKDLIYQCSQCYKGFTNKNKLVKHKNCSSLIEDDGKRKTDELNEVEEQNIISDVLMENDDINEISEQTISCDVVVENYEIKEINDQNSFENVVEQQTVKNERKISNSEIIRFISTIRTNSSTELFHCPFCETKLVLKSSLRNHMIRDHSIKGSKIKCYICDIGFIKKSQLKIHEQCGRHKKFEKRLRNPKQLITELEIQPLVNETFFNGNNDLKEVDKSLAKKSIVIELPSENTNGEISNFEGYYFEEDEIFDMKADGFFHCPYCPKILERASFLRTHIERHNNSANDVLNILRSTKQKYFKNIEILKKARKDARNLKNKLEAVEIDPIAITDNNIQLEEIFTQNNDSDKQLEDIFGKEEEEDNSVTVINEVDRNSIGEKNIENWQTEEISEEKENIQEEIIYVENIENENLVENNSEIVEEVYETQSNKLKTTETEFSERRELNFKNSKRPNMFEKVGNEKVYEILEDLEKYKTEGKFVCPICKDKNDKKYVHGALRRHLLTLHGNTEKDILHQCFKCKQGFSAASKLRKHMNNFCPNRTKNYFWPMQECYLWEKSIKTESRKISKINNINNYETEINTFTEEISGKSENVQEENIEVENMETCKLLESNNEQSNNFKNVNLENKYIDNIHSKISQEDENYSAVVGNSEEVFIIEYLNENENILEEIFEAIPEEILQTSFQEKIETNENINQSCSSINEISTTFLKEKLYKELGENESKNKLLKQQNKMNRLIDIPYKAIQSPVKIFQIEKPNEVHNTSSKINKANKNELISKNLKITPTQNQNDDTTMMTKKQLKKTYKCMFCDKISNTSLVHNHHMKTHTGEKPFECLLCQKQFSTRQAKVIHDSYHKTKDRIFPCTLYCERSFYTASDRKRHEQRCVKIKPSTFKFVQKLTKKTKNND